MTDETTKKSTEQQKKKVRKVTTGAWWKSAAPSEPTEEKIPPEQQKETEPPKKAKKKTVQKNVPESEIDTSRTAKKAAVSRKPLQEIEKSQSPTVPVQIEAKTEQTEQTEKSDNTAQKTTEEQANKKSEVKREKSKKNYRKKNGSRNETKKKGVAEKKAIPEENSNKNSEEVIAKLLVNADEPEECRIALVENGRLESLHVNTVVRERTKNNIYKGRIVSIESNLQAAFVEIGTDRNGFLPFNDIHPEYYKQDINEQSRRLIREHQWKKLKIEDVVSRGQEVLVQVVKEVTGNKGANMTTYLSLPGRCLVLMPGSDSSGISRKISGEKRRSQLREIMSGFNMPEEIGYIVRTASAEITKTALQQDFRYLISLWKEIKQRGQTSSAPALIYEDQDTVVRFLRDYFVPEIQEIFVDTQESYDQVNKFVSLLPARQKKVQVKLHRGAKPIFNQNNIEEQIESIYQPQVPLPSGGSIVIDPTEALVAIDVNSGRTSQKGDFDKSIFLANMEAADELARQLRLRDLGGLIVVDFIDMRNKSHTRDVEKQVKRAMKRDKAKVDISRISRFGLMQISRQKMGAPIEKGCYHRCAHCEGRGKVRSVETLALYYLRRIQTGVSRKKIRQVEARLPLEVGRYLLNKKRAEIIELENRHRASIDVIPLPEMKPADNKIDFLV